ncbi:MAG: hypothetical protein HYW86_01010 [Candidatus Roizmanbacteria bacterium]|nr:MAG: hypothetical protein HYW86_01010 [Candidatus Roizmanbacteria bacterium]
MKILWQIKYYQSQFGSKPVEDFINSLEEKTQAKITRSLELLEEFGINLKYPHAKKISGKTQY